MLTKRLLFLIAGFGVFLAIVTGAVACEWRSNEDGELHLHEDDVLHRIAGGVTLVADPAHVKLESENRIHLRVSVNNSGNEPILAWALDLGDGLYLVKAEPGEQHYHESGHHGDQKDEHNGDHEDEHNGDHAHEHGNVLIYGIPIEPGDSLQVELTLGVLFDIEGKLDPNPELRLFYAHGTKGTRTPAAEELQRFQDTLLTHPFVEVGIHIER